MGGRHRQRAGWARIAGSFPVRGSVVIATATAAGACVVLTVVPAAFGTGQRPHQLDAAERPDVPPTSASPTARPSPAPTRAERQAAPPVSAPTRAERRAAPPVSATLAGTSRQTRATEAATSPSAPSSASTPTAASSVAHPPEAPAAPPARRIAVPPPAHHAARPLPAPSHTPPARPHQHHGPRQDGPGRPDYPGSHRHAGGRHRSHHH